MKNICIKVDTDVWIKIKILKVTLKMKSINEVFKFLLNSNDK